MDIQSVKQRYGDRVALAGNIFMRDLVHKSPADIEAQVRFRLETIGARGGYIVATGTPEEHDPSDGAPLRD